VKELMERPLGGLRLCAIVNTEVVSALLDDLAARGVDFSIPCLYILDGAKALAAAVGKHAGSAALIQRCILHKQRNVVGHLPEQCQADVKRKLKNAYAMADYDKAKESLQKLHRELMHLNPSAARSLEEGMEETRQPGTGRGALKGRACRGPAPGGVISCAEPMP
jgi:transposase-like protein